jgi:hypothetical protein
MPVGRQFSTAQELEAAVTQAWSDVDQKTLEKLATSMTDRLVTVIEKRGRWTGCCGQNLFRFHVRIGKKLICSYNYCQAKNPFFCLNSDKSKAFPLIFALKMCICILNIVLKFGGNWLRESIFMVKFSMFVYLLPALY